jgi:hypothetical protein
MSQNRPFHTNFEHIHIELTDIKQSIIYEKTYFNFL